MGNARLRLASAIAFIVSMAAVFAYSDILEAGTATSITWTLVPTAFIALPYAWAMAGHWNIPRTFPALLTALGIAINFLAITFTLAAIHGGEGTQFALVAGLITAVPALTFGMTALLAGRHDRLS